MIQSVNKVAMDKIIDLNRRMAVIKLKLKREPHLLKEHTATLKRLEAERKPLLEQL